MSTIGYNLEKITELFVVSLKYADIQGIFSTTFFGVSILYLTKYQLTVGGVVY